jgi:hypothetical protein
MLENLLERIDQHEFETIGEDIKQALSEHRKWMHKISYALLTNQAIKSSEFIALDAHKYCEFGRWIEYILQDEAFHQDFFLDLASLH